MPVLGLWNLSPFLTVRHPHKWRDTFVSSYNSYDKPQFESSHCSGGQGHCQRCLSFWSSHKPKNTGVWSLFLGTHFRRIGQICRLETSLFLPSHWQNSFSFNEAQNKIEMQLHELMNQYLIQPTSEQMPLEEDHENQQWLLFCNLLVPHHNRILPTRSFALWKLGLLSALQKHFAVLLGILPTTKMRPRWLARAVIGTKQERCWFVWTNRTCKHPDSVAESQGGGAMSCINWVRVWTNEFPNTGSRDIAAFPLPCSHDRQ